MGEKHKQTVERQFARAVEHCGGYLARDGPEVIAEKVEFVEPRSGEVALDVACGSGTFALALAQRLERVYGVDLTLEMLGEARKGLKRPDAKAAGKVAFYRAEADTLPFADGTFDLVTCGHSFHHFPEPEKMLTEMTRVTKPTARLGIFDSVAPEEQPAWELHNRSNVSATPHMPNRCEPRASCKCLEIMGLRWKPTPPADAPVPFANGCHAGELNLRTRITKSSKKSYWTVYRTAGRFLRHVRRATTSSSTPRKLSFFFAS